MTNISQPHDHFLKELLSYPEQAGTLLRERLPAPVVKSLSAKPPRLVDATFVDKKLREHLSTAEQGGDPGFVSVDQLKGSIAKLAVGKPSKPFKTDLGWHIAKVEKK
uniref:PPIC-type PPIASE domain-containing protein n=1 Tax=Candidatus Kentrum sp. SD TaxID=2126332 RepID=A0A450YMS8_9GAMM|nr:MAG: PPIC-type PPIASE domain-containing protein [Candidatus Kentron sp. SD]